MTLLSWMGTRPYADLVEERQRRAVIAWNIIQEHPVSVAFKPATGSRLDPQTVRLDSDNRASFPQAVSGTAPKRQVIIHGIKDHPTVPNTVIKEGYTFFFDGDTYIVKDIIDNVIGEIQAIAEASR